MSPIARAARKTFSSLRIRNWRLYLAAQLISVSGTWMQWVAQSWLVLRMSESGVAVGLVTALHFAPMLVGGMWAGLAADRLDKRRVLLFTQGSAGVLALLLGALTAAGVVEIWMIYVLAFANGLVMLLDTPARHAFVTELVGPEQVANAVALNSAVFNVGRIVGPAVAALLIASVGLAPAFFVNGVSYVAVVIALRQLDLSALHPVQRAPRAPGQLRETLTLLRERRSLRHALMLVAIVTTFGLNFTVFLPLLAKFDFKGDAGTYGLLTSVMAGGATVGALAAAGRGRPTMRLLVVSAAAFGISGALTAAAPTVFTSSLALLAVGFTSMVFLITAHSLIQVRSPELMRGRVMALYALVFLGGTALGGPIAGGLSEAFGARTGIAAGAALSLVAAAAIWVLRYRRTPEVLQVGG